MMNKSKLLKVSALTTVLLSSASAFADQVIQDDLVVTSSICVGMDCSNGESFGFDTIRLKENNLRIKAVDTSNSGAFPSNDWQITFNDSGNGGQNKFSIDDIDGGRTPFTIEASAPSNSLYVDDGGRIGLGTATPVVEMHIVDGDSPTLRLEQDGSSGFTAQTWDVVGNETNFFVRDATNGSELPFKIRPGADDNSLFIDQDGDIGMGTASPDADLDVENSTGPSLRLTQSAANYIDQAVDSNGYYYIKKDGLNLTFIQSNDANPVQLRLNTASTNRRILAVDGSSLKSQVVLADGSIELLGGASGNINLATFTDTNFSVPGSITVNSTVVHPDYVFEPDYKLMPLTELQSFISTNKHLPEIPSAKEVEKNGINMTEMQILLLKKVEELTLYTLKQEAEIKSLKGL